MATKIFREEPSALAKAAFRVLDTTESIRGMSPLARGGTSALLGGATGLLFTQCDALNAAFFVANAVVLATTLVNWKSRKLGPESCLLALADVSFMMGAHALKEAILG
jgi:hypothetical protein